MIIFTCHLQDGDRVCPNRAFGVNVGAEKERTKVLEIAPVEGKFDGVAEPATAQRYEMALLTEWPCKTGKEETTLAFEPLPREIFPEKLLLEVH